jgi:branched-chain amino acid transport system substrate-binding protein
LRSRINANGGVLGRPIEPVMYDPASDPKKFRAFAERLFQVDRIRLLFGCYMSSTRKAVLPVVEAHRGLLFYPTLYEGFEYSRHCIYTGAAPIRIRCNWRNSCYRPTATASCSSVPTTSTPMNRTA